MQITNEELNNIKITPLLETLRMEDISDDIYFSERFANYISNSRLGLLKNKGAEVFFNGLKDDGSFNSSYQFGSALHQLVLQPENYVLVEEAFKPTAKAGIMADYLYKSDGSQVTDDEIKIASIKCNYYKDKFTSNRLLEFKNKAESYWRDRFLFEQKTPKIEGVERIYLDEKSVGLLKCCIDAVKKNKEFQNLLYPKGLLEPIYSANERAILLDLKIEDDNYSEIYRFKAKLDNFTIDKEENVITVNDLKTTSKLAKDFDLTYFSYQRELAIYSWLLNYCSKQFFDLEKPTIKGNFLVVSTVPDYVTMVYPMTKKLYKSGFEEFKYLMKTVFYLNKYKGYSFNEV